MKLRSIYFCILSCCLLLFACRQEDNVRLIPVNDFFKSQDRMSYRISPDGKDLSYLKQDGKIQNLYIEDINSGVTTQITKSEGKNISFYSWVSNNELIYYKELEGMKSQSDIFIINKDGSKERQLTFNEQSRMQVIDDQLIDDKYLLVTSNKRDSAVIDVYRLNVRDGKIEMAARNPGNVTNWITDAEGKLRLATSSDGVNETLLYRQDEQHQFRPILTNNFTTRVRPVAFAENKPNVIYAISNANRDKNALVEIDCTTGKENRALFSSDKLNVIDAQYSRSKKRMAFVVYETWKRQKFYLDDSVKKLYDQLDKLLPNTESRITGRDKAENTFIVRTFTDRNPGSYYLYFANKGTIRKLGDLNSSIKEAEMSEMKPISFKSRDGLNIEGYLTLPLHRQPNNLPVVVLPHGGPGGRNSWGYNAEVQFLANRGYAVFQVNYRGSSGYGKKFYAAGFKQWGGKINQDIEDGVKWLISEEIADAKRVAIYGSGFGGFIALSSCYKNPGNYVCAASNSGVINLLSYLNSIPPFYQANVKMYYDILGNPEKDGDYMTQASPVFNADKMNIPLFIAVNTKDSRINAGESILYVKKLKKKNANVTYFENGDNPFASGRDEGRQKFYAALEQFLAANLNRK